MEESSSNELVKAVLTICSKQDQSNRRMWDLLERLLRFSKGDKDLGNVVTRLSQEWISKEQDAYFQPRAMLMLLNLISILKRDGHVNMKWSFALIRGIYYDQKREQSRDKTTDGRRRMHRVVPKIQIQQILQHTSGKYQNTELESEMMNSRTSVIDHQQELTSQRENTSGRARSSIRSFINVPNQDELNSEKRERRASCEERGDIDITLKVKDELCRDKKMYQTKRVKSKKFEDDIKTESERKRNEVCRDMEKEKEQSTRLKRLAGKKEIESESIRERTELYRDVQKMQSTQIKRSKFEDELKSQSRKLRKSAYQDELESSVKQFRKSAYQDELESSAKQFKNKSYQREDNSKSILERNSSHKHINKSSFPRSRKCLLDELEASSERLTHSSYEDNLITSSKPRRSASIGDDLEPYFRRKRDSYEEDSSYRRGEDSYEDELESSYRRRKSSFQDQIERSSRSGKDRVKTLYKRGRYTSSEDDLDSISNASFKDRARSPNTKEIKTTSEEELELSSKRKRNPSVVNAPCKNRVRSSPYTKERNPSLDEDLESKTKASTNPSLKNKVKSSQNITERITTSEEELESSSRPRNRLQRHTTSEEELKASPRPRRKASYKDKTNLPSRSQKQANSEEEVETAPRRKAPYKDKTNSSSRSQRKAPYKDLAESSSHDTSEEALELSPRPSIFGEDLDSSSNQELNLSSSQELDSKSKPHSNLPSKPFLRSKLNRSSKEDLDSLSNQPVASKDRSKPSSRSDRYPSFGQDLHSTSEDELQSQSKPVRYPPQDNLKSQLNPSSIEKPQSSSERVRDIPYLDSKDSSSEEELQLKSKQAINPLSKDKLRSQPNLQVNSSFGIQYEPLFEEELGSKSKPPRNPPSQNKLRSQPKLQVTPSLALDIEPLSQRGINSSFEDASSSKRGINTSSEEIRVYNVYTPDETKESRSMSLDTSHDEPNQHNRSTSQIPKRSRAWQKLLRSAKHTTPDISVSKSSDSDSKNVQPLDESDLHISKSDSSILINPNVLETQLSLPLSIKVNSDPLTGSSDVQDSSDFTFRHDNRIISKPQDNIRSLFGPGAEDVGTLESSDEGRSVFMSYTFNSPKHKDIEKSVKPYMDYFDESEDQKLISGLGKQDAGEICSVSPFEEIGDKKRFNKLIRVEKGEVSSFKPIIEREEKRPLAGIYAQDKSDIASSNPLARSIDKKPFEVLSVGITSPEALNESTDKTYYTAISSQDKDESINQEPLNISADRKSSSALLSQNKDESTSPLTKPNTKEFSTPEPSIDNVFKRPNAALSVQDKPKSITPQPTIGNIDRISLAALSTKARDDTVSALSIQDKSEPSTLELPIMKKRSLNSLSVTKPIPTQRDDLITLTDTHKHLAPNIKIPHDASTRHGYLKPQEQRENIEGSRTGVAEKESNQITEGRTPEFSSGLNDYLLSPVTDDAYDTQNLWKHSQPPNRLKYRSSPINKSIQNPDSPLISKLSDPASDLSAYISSTQDILNHLPEASSSLRSANPSSLPAFSSISTPPQAYLKHTPEIYSTHGRYHSFNPIYHNLEVTRASGIDIDTPDVEEPKLRSKSALSIQRELDDSNELELRIRIKAGELYRHSPEPILRTQSSNTFFKCVKVSDMKDETNSWADIEPKKLLRRTDNLSYQPQTNKEEISLRDSEVLRSSKDRADYMRSTQVTPDARSYSGISRSSSVSPMRLVTQTVPSSSIFKALENKTQPKLNTTKTESYLSTKSGPSTQEFKDLALRTHNYKPSPIDKPLSSQYPAISDAETKPQADRSKAHPMSVSHEPIITYLNHSTESEGSNLADSRLQDDSFGVHKEGKLSLSSNLLSELGKSNSIKSASCQHTRYSSIGKHISDETQPESYSTLSLSPSPSPYKLETSDTSQLPKTQIKASTLPQKGLKFIMEDPQSSNCKDTESPERDLLHCGLMSQVSPAISSTDPSFPSYDECNRPSSLRKPPKSTIRSYNETHMRSSESFDTEESLPDFKPSSISDPIYCQVNSKINFDYLQLRQLKTPELSEITGGGQDESYSGPGDSFEDINLSSKLDSGNHSKSGYITDEEKSDSGYHKKKSAIYVIDEENSEITDTHYYDTYSSDHHSDRLHKFRKPPRRIDDTDSRYKKYIQDGSKKPHSQDKRRSYSDKLQYPKAKQLETVLDQSRLSERGYSDMSPSSNLYRDLNSSSNSQSYIEYESPHRSNSYNMISSTLYPYNSKIPHPISSSDRLTRQISPLPLPQRAAYVPHHPTSHSSKQGLRSNLYIPSMHHEVSDPSDQDSISYPNTSSKHISIPQRSLPNTLSKPYSSNLNQTSDYTSTSQLDQSSSYNTDQSNLSKASRRYNPHIELLSDSHLKELISKCPYYLQDEDSPSFPQVSKDQHAQTNVSLSNVEESLDTTRLNHIYQAKITAADSIALILYKKQILFQKEFFNCIHVIKIKLLLRQLESSLKYQRTRKQLVRCFSGWHKGIQDRKLYTYSILLKLESFCSKRYHQDLDPSDSFSKKAGAFILWKISSKLQIKRSTVRYVRNLDSSVSTIPLASNYQSPYQSRYPSRGNSYNYLDTYHQTCAETLQGQNFKSCTLDKPNLTHDKPEVTAIDFNYSFRPSKVVEKLLLRQPNSIHQYIDDMYEVSKEKLEACYLSNGQATSRYRHSQSPAESLSAKSTPHRSRYPQKPAERLINLRNQ